MLILNIPLLLKILGISNIRLCKYTLQISQIKKQLFIGVLWRTCCFENFLKIDNGNIWVFFDIFRALPLETSMYIYIYI